MNRLFSLQWLSGNHCSRKDEFRVGLEELIPRTPVRFASIRDGSVSTAITHVQQVGTFLQDQLDQIKVRLTGPRSIVQDGSAIVVADTNWYMSLVNQELDNVEKVSAACQMEKRLSKFVAAFEGSSILEELSQGINVLSSDRGKNLSIICFNFFLGVFREKSLHVK